jgi:hypothetical protein
VYNVVLAQTTNMYSRKITNLSCIKQECNNRISVLAELRRALRLILSQMLAASKQLDRCLILCRDFFYTVVIFGGYLILRTKTVEFIF